MRSALLLSVLLAVLGSCATVPNRSPQWRSQVVLEVPGTKLLGCAIGDADPQHFGNEIAVAAGNGLVYVVRHQDDTWHHEVAAALRGEPIQCAIGDVDRLHEGAEIVTVGMLRGDEDTGSGGAAMLLRRTDSGWEKVELLRTNALLHGVCIGDVDPTRVGIELAVAGADGEVHLVWQSGVGWASKIIGEVPGTAKSMTLGLGGLLVACDDGSLVRFRLRPRGWVRDVVSTGSSALARVGATFGMAIWCANDGALRLLREGYEEVVLRSTDRLRGAVLADLDPSRTGLEGATAGYDGLISVIHGGPIAWERLSHHGGVAHVFEITVVAADSDRLHHLAAGPLPQRGTALVACGYSGRVTCVWWAGE
tara:strand:- start:938 stop:2032 length:1095 start_codon:yes stop_codon:yes gene_type:complete